MSVDESKVPEGLLRIGAALALSLFAVAALSAWIENPARITLLLLVATESINVVLVLAARRTDKRDWQPLSVVPTVCATFYFLLLTTEPGIALLPQWLASIVQCAGLAWQIYAKVSLGRSFGLLPADRGLVTTGAYRWVRHPIYLGYFIAHVAFLLANFGVHNLLVFAALYLLQLLRLLREEKLLAENRAYRDYCRRVPYRVVPHVF